MAYFTSFSIDAADENVISSSSWLQNQDVKRKMFQKGEVKVTFIQRDVCFITALAGKPPAAARSCVSLWMSVSTRCRFNWHGAEQLWCMRRCGGGERETGSSLPRSLPSLATPRRLQGELVSHVRGAAETKARAEDVTKSNAPCFFLADWGKSLKTRTGRTDS